MYSSSRDKSRHGFVRTTEGHAKFAALGLVNGQAVGKLERVTGLVAKLTWIEPVLVAELTGELDLELPRKAFEPLRLVLADDDADFAVGEISLAFRLGPYVAPMLIKDVDDLIAVE